MIDARMTDNGIAIRTDLRPGDLGRLISLHGTAYEGENGHFGLAFEAYVARTVADFVIDNKAKGRVFLAERGDELVACTAMVERENGRGQLRWVLASPSARGLGLGRTLVGAALDYAREQGWREALLETTAGLDTSMSLYDRLGFVVASRSDRMYWNAPADVIVMTLKL